MTDKIKPEVSSIRYLYLRDYDRNRHVCIARRVNFVKKTVEFAYSVSCPEDTFKKKTARLLASGRLSAKSKKFYCEVELGDMKPIEKIIDVLSKGPKGSVQRLAQQEKDWQPWRLFRHRPSSDRTSVDATELFK